MPTNTDPPRRFVLSHGAQMHQHDIDLPVGTTLAQALDALKNHAGSFPSLMERVWVRFKKYENHKPRTLTDHLMYVARFVHGDTDTGWGLGFVSGTPEVHALVTVRQPHTYTPFGQVMRGAFYDARPTHGGTYGIYAEGRWPEHMKTRR